MLSYILWFLYMWPFICIVFFLLAQAEKWKGEQGCLQDPDYTRTWASWAVYLDLISDSKTAFTPGHFLIAGRIAAILPTI